MVGTFPGLGNGLARFFHAHHLAVILIVAVAAAL